MLRRIGKDRFLSSRIGVGVFAGQRCIAGSGIAIGVGLPAFVAAGSSFPAEQTQRRSDAGRPRSQAGR